MKRDWKYIAYLIAAVGIYLAIKLTAPREFDWTISYHHTDKNPYGAFALNETIRDIFPDQEFQQNNFTSYELLDTVSTPVNFISFSTSFHPGDEDVKALLKNIERGGTALIGAQYFSGKLTDTLEFYTSDYFFEKDTYGFFLEDDSSKLSFKNSFLKTSNEYIYPRKNIHNYFQEFDSTKTSIVAQNDLELPIILRIKWGSGYLILCSTPLIFTNIYLLQGNNSTFVQNTLSLLPKQSTYWTEYYHLGRMELQSPLRFVLQQESLSWAYYVIVLSLLLFILFEIKRKQRIIPIIKPLTNTSLEFIATIGNLYYQAKDHKDIALKRISFLIDQLRTKYGFSMNHIDKNAIHSLAKRTGNTDEQVSTLLQTIELIQSKQTITEEELKQLNKKIEDFRY